jgi:hypothetical protein
MRPRPYEIFLAKVRLRRSEDLRPWVVVQDPVPDPDDPTKLLVTLAPVSSRLDLADSSRDFFVPSDDPDFGPTGLRRSSYVIGNLPVRVSVERLERKVGELRGDLLHRFQDWCDE